MESPRGTPWTVLGLLCGTALGVGTALLLHFWMPALPVSALLLVGIAAVLAGALAGAFAARARRRQSVIALVAAILLAVNLAALCLVDAFALLALALGFRGFGAGGGPVAPPTFRTGTPAAATTPNTIDLALLQEKLDRPARAVSYTWNGSGRLERVELRVKVESTTGATSEVKRSWPSWNPGETKRLELPAVAGEIKPLVASGTAVLNGRRHQLGAMTAPQ